MVSYSDTVTRFHVGIDDNLVVAVILKLMVVPELVGFGPGVFFQRYPLCVCPGESDGLKVMPLIASTGGASNVHTFGLTDMFPTFTPWNETETDQSLQ